jgi:hypothetical protein
VIVRRCYVGGMKLADQVAQCRTPVVVRDDATAAEIHLNNAAECSSAVASAPFRFVLSDDLTRLCTALAYSKGARTLACADLVRVPAESVWIEWCSEPFDRELERYGFERDREPGSRGGRCGVLLRASRDGRRGVLRTFWTAQMPGAVLASSVEAYFDLDTPPGEDPEPPAGDPPSPERIGAEPEGDDDILARCFRFRYERSWQRYYQTAGWTESERVAVWRHSLGTVAIDIPVILGFLLLLGTRSGLPQRPSDFERLNRARLKAGKAPLLEHVDVSAPILPGYASWGGNEASSARRSPRLHHVRGHLVRRGSQLFWRVPHLRGSPSLGSVRSRTVTWTVDGSLSGLA